MFKINGIPLASDTAFTANNIQYPANWLRLSTQAERESLGITEEVDPVRPDDRFYFVSQNEDGTFETIPRDLNSLKEAFVAASKAATNRDLAQTDWYLVRAIDPSRQVPVPQDIINIREAIRAAADTYESAVLAATDLVAFIEIVSPTVKAVAETSVA